MFSLLDFVGYRRRNLSLAVSLVSHFIFLGWLLHAPPPVFVAPSSVTRGESGRSVTPIYFGGSTGITLEHPTPRLTLHRLPTKPQLAQLAPPDAKSQAGNEIRTEVSANAAPAGSPYGSLSYGTFGGPEVHPAWPVFAPEPALPSELRASVTGDVVIEVTIDEQGVVVHTAMIQSLDPALDQKVLTAVVQWRFHPATKDGVPIASKHDVYYHFPR
jgi:TonB family protein